MKFKLYYQKQPAVRAPSVVSFDDYELAGEIEAESRNMVITRTEMAVRPKPELPNLPDLTPREEAEPEEKFEYKRPITVGDLIVDEQEVAWIFTPMWVWAKVSTLASADITMFTA
jgi:hypothetical protein